MAVNNIKVKPCPFCGGTNIVVLPKTCNEKTPYNQSDRAYPVVVCYDCGGNMQGEDWGAQITAVIKWNKRTELEE